MLAAAGAADGGPKDFHTATRDARYPNYPKDRELLQRAVRQFVDHTGASAYLVRCAEVLRRERIVFPLVLDDVASLGEDFRQLARRISMNVVGYTEEICRVVDATIAELADGGAALPAAADAIDYLAVEARAAGQALPAILTRRFELVLVPLAEKCQPLALRALRASVIGTLVVVRGVCIAATAVRPKLLMLTSLCELCGEAAFQQVVGDRVTPQVVCTSQRCKLRNAVGRLLVQHKASRFVKFQELRLQELTRDVPKGAIPRTIRVVCEGEQTRIATPGQVVRIVGTYCPDPSTGQGQEAMRASTMVKTIVRAMHIELEKRSYDEAADALAEQVARARAHPDRPAVLAKLTRSIAPEIWGMEDVKRALLCLLVGGSGTTASGIKIRSDINILFMGDPGVAKSQLLKWISTVAPRSIFTTGKGSSGVGLTAAVTRDTHTGEAVLEGGALVLSDHGICCIDELDKMDEGDRTSLHEVMEQQSVSIAKAGIITTLNARTSILAAANPKFGRWRRNASPSENVNLPPSLLSRFDLLWLLLDEADRERDAELSMHVTHVHLHGVAPGRVVDDSAAAAGGADGGAAAAAAPIGGAGDYFSRDMVRAYVGEARKLHPVLEDAAAKVITDIYIDMRSKAVRQNNVVTARTLLSLVRLSQAHARLRFSESVTREDVAGAAHLLECCKASLNERGGDGGFGGGRRGGGGGPTTDAGIFAVIKDFAKDRPVVSLDALRPSLMILGVNEEMLQRCVQTYTDVGVWTLESGSLHFL